MTNKHYPIHAAERCMRQLKKSFPTIDQRLDALLADRRRGLPENSFLAPYWPDTEEMPNHAAAVIALGLMQEQSIINPMAKSFDELLRQKTEMGEMWLESEQIMAYQLWRTSKQILKFDPDLAIELRDQDLDDCLPGAVFDFLPYKMMYIECPITRKNSGGSIESIGMWVFKTTLFYDGRASGERCLMIMYLDATGEMTELPISLEFQTISGIVEDLAAHDLESWKEFRRRGYEIDGATGNDLQDKEIIASRVHGQLKQILNLIIYICAQNADLNIVYRPNPTIKPNPKKANKRSEATITEVGMRIGGALRSARSRFQEAQGQPGVGHKAPHVRRSHWHHFWTGPRDGDRRLIVKWLNDTLVNADEGNAVPTIKFVD